MIDNMIREYKDLAAHICRFNDRWYENVVAVEGGLHLTPRAFSALCAAKNFSIEKKYHEGNMHLSANDATGTHYVCVIPGKLVPPKEEAAQWET